MYSQDPKVQRRKMKIRFFTYGIMAIVTVVFAAVGLLYVLGYRLDDSFELERGALVKFESFPSGATITLDGTPINDTDYQTNVSAGQHTVSFSLEGYQGWQKNIELKPGEVRYLTYARLLPTSITTNSILSLESLEQSSASPNRRWYVLSENTSNPVFSIIDARDTEITPEALELPVSSYTGPANNPNDKFEIVSWSNDSDFLLVRHTLSGGEREYIRVPRSAPEDSVNLTELFELDIRQPVFASNTAGTIFALDPNDTLYRLVVADPEEPIVIARQVDAFDARTAAKVAYVNPAAENEEIKANTQPNERSLKIWRREGEDATELKPVPSGVPVHINYQEYFNKEYVALIAGSSVNVIESPLESEIRTVLAETLEFTPSYTSSSPNDRFILAARGEQTYVYDIEIEEPYTFTLPDQVRRLQWLDNHHLGYTGGGSLRLVEFDGANMQFVTSIEGAYDVLLRGDGEILLSIGEQANQPVVQRSFLLNPEDR